MTEGRRFRIVVLVTLVCFLAASCSSSRLVAPVDYANLEPAKRSYLDVRTRNERYLVTKFSMTDSTLVVKEVEGGTYPNEPSVAVPNLPYAIPLDEIDSVTEVRSSPTKFWIGIGVAAIVVAGLIILINESFEDTDY